MEDYDGGRGRTEEAGLKDDEMGSKEGKNKRTRGGFYKNVLTKE